MAFQKRNCGKAAKQQKRCTVEQGARNGQEKVSCETAQQKACAENFYFLDLNHIPFPDARKNEPP